MTVERTFAATLCIIPTKPCGEQSTPSVQPRKSDASPLVIRVDHRKLQHHFQRRLYCRKAHRRAANFAVVHVAMKERAVIVLGGNVDEADGFVGVPPSGPAMPVQAMERPASERASAPWAISMAVSFETAPYCLMVIGKMPSNLDLGLFE